MPHSKHSNNSRADLNSQCLGKFPYDSRVMANEVCARTNKKAKHRLQVYHCKGCGMFHLGASSTKH